MKRLIVITLAALLLCGCSAITDPPEVADKSGGGGLHYDVPEPPSGGGGLHRPAPTPIPPDTGVMPVTSKAAVPPTMIIDDDAAVHGKDGKLIAWRVGTLLMDATE